jgi:hypothetical protein
LNSYYSNDRVFDLTGETSQGIGAMKDMIRFYLYQSTIPYNGKDNDNFLLPYIAHVTLEQLESIPRFCEGLHHYTAGNYDEFLAYNNARNTPITGNDDLSTDVHLFVTYYRPMFSHLSDRFKSKMASIGDRKGEFCFHQPSKWFIQVVENLREIEK